MGRGFLGTRATLVADINLILQIAVLIVLTISIFRTRGRNVDLGRRLLSVAVVVNAVLIIAIMNPAFFRILPFALRNPRAPTPSVIWPHVIFGALAELIGVYLVVSANLDWARPLRLREVRWTAQAALRLMFLLWVVALLIGFAVYSVRYR